MGTNNRIREEWIKATNTRNPFQIRHPFNGNFELHTDAIADWWLSKIAELLKSQKEEITEIIRKTNELEISDWIKKGGAGMIKDNFISKINEI